MPTEELTKEDVAAFEEMRQADKTAEETSKLEIKPAEEKPAKKPEKDESDDQPEDETDEAEGEEPVKEATGKDGKPKKRGTVAVLIETREALKTAEKLAQDNAIRAAQAEERIKVWNEAFARQNLPAQVKAEMPDIDKDPVAAIKYMAQKNAEYEQRFHAQQQIEQQRQNEQMLKQRTDAAEAEFVAKTPDYIPAVSKLIEQRTKELQAVGYAGDQVRIQLQNEARALAMQALQKGQNPAEVLYNMAMIRGFSPPQVQVAPTEDITERLTRIEAGQKANASLSDVSGGSTNTGKLTGKTLASMGEEEFAKALKGMSRADQIALMGS